MGKLKFTTAPKIRVYQDARPWLERNLHFQFCAYCVVSHDSLDIEHYEPKKMSPKKVDDAKNLLLGCGRCNGPAGKSDYHPRHNGRRRQRGTKFNVIDIRKLDFAKVFEIDRTGEIRPRKNKNKEMAIKNIVLMNLDRPFLTQMRRQYLELLETAKLISAESDDPALKSCYSRILSGLAAYELFFYVFDFPFNRRITRSLPKGRVRASRWGPRARTRS